LDGGPTTRLTSENVGVLEPFCETNYNPEMKFVQGAKLWKTCRFFRFWHQKGKDGGEINIGACRSKIGHVNAKVEGQRARVNEAPLQLAYNLRIWWGERSREPDSVR
jgi:hypothetical protein